MRMLRVGMVVLFVACRDANAPQPAAAGEVCAIGDRVTHPCSGALKCTPQTFTPPPPAAEGEVRGPDKASGIGGACGGVAGFHCVDGLACDMTPEQERAADGMGSCARSSVCR